MTTKDETATSAAAGTAIALPALLLAAIGLVIVIVTGHVQAGTLHDAAHDVRHATGFPCH
jgi:cobalt transporter subunit CbtB